MLHLFRSSTANSLLAKRKSRNPIFADENASLAQGLLRALLKLARIELFSPEGGGVVVMRLERWQIDLLENYGIQFVQFPSDSRASQKTGKKQHRNQIEYLHLKEGIADCTANTLLNKNNDLISDDILADWKDKI